ncbi:MAG: hypothetical protein A2760_03570 [Candidatus Doudnabacteria bacterium RIFCSPHIGHO2_01_FULL_50_67]|nr:MAG: hypothetical protein A2760_03570 [Candidatus Doudnabacteria bacterium RIFCSPHIGHO2_01_FULL_50_67]
MPSRYEETRSGEGFFFVLYFGLAGMAWFSHAVEFDWKFKGYFVAGIAAPFLWCAVTALRDKRTTWARELRYWVALPIGGWSMQMLLWPIALPLHLLLSGQSFRQCYEFQRAIELHDMHGDAGMRHDTADQCAASDVRKIDWSCDDTVAAAAALGQTVTAATATACRTGVVAASITAAGTTAFAQTKPAVTLSANIADHYVVKPGREVHDRPVVQTSLTFDLGRGFSLDVWGSTDFGLNRNSGREIDWTVFWSGKSARVGVTYFDLNPLVSRAGTDIVNPFVSYSRPKPWHSHTIAPYIYLDGMFPTKQTGRDLGAFLSGGVRDNWRLTGKLGLRQEASALYDTGFFRKPAGVFANYRAALDIRATPRLTITPLSLRVIGPIIGARDRKLQAVFGGGLTYAWGN